MSNEVKKMASFKLNADTIIKLDALSKLSGQSKSEIVDDLIFNAYDKVNNNQEARQMLDKLREVQAILQGFQK